MVLAVQPELGANLSPNVHIRPAATLVLWRSGVAGPEVLMGQRGAQAAFMPSKYVFPGGAVDAGDENLACEITIASICNQRLQQNCPVDAPSPRAIMVAAVRELWEETGLHMVATPNTNNDMRFIFRAITPPGRSRRFDARFFLAGASSILGNAEDFSAASDELSHLQWIGLGQTRALDLPFITEVVLSEISHLIHGHSMNDGVPFFDNSGEVPTFRRLR